MAIPNVDPSLTISDSERPEKNVITEWNAILQVALTNFVAGIAGVMLFVVCVSKLIVCSIFFLHPYISKYKAQVEKHHYCS